MATKDGYSVFETLTPQGKSPKTTLLCKCDTPTSAQRAGRKRLRESLPEGSARFVEIVSPDGSKQRVTL